MFRPQACTDKGNLTPLDKSAKQQNKVAEISLMQLFTRILAHSTSPTCAKWRSGSHEFDAAYSPTHDSAREEIGLSNNDGWTGKPGGQYLSTYNSGRIQHLPLIYRSARDYTTLFSLGSNVFVK